MQTRIEHDTMGEIEMKRYGEHKPNVAYRTSKWAFTPCHDSSDGIGKKSSTNAELGQLPQDLSQYIVGKKWLQENGTHSSHS